MKPHDGWSGRRGTDPPPAQDETPKDFEAIHLSKHGNSINMLVSSSVIEYAGGRAILSANRDVTLRKRTEAENNRLAAAVEQVADSIVVTDPTGRIQYVNPAFTRITGYSQPK